MGELSPIHWFIVLGFFTLYFLPAVIGRNKRNFRALFFLNLLAGWTFIGWLIAFVWALTQDPPLPAAIASAPAPAQSPDPNAERDTRNGWLIFLAVVVVVALLEMIRGGH